MTDSFIERQFPVSKVSKESYKERKANNGQTLTGLGKWWGRKPLILVRAAILGCLFPASNNPEKDNDIFLKLLRMDKDSLLARKDKILSVTELYHVVSHTRNLVKYLRWFEIKNNNKISLIKNAPKDEIEKAVFNTFGYDAKISLCKRPEQMDTCPLRDWDEINEHLGTNASNFTELIEQLSIMKFGHPAVIGDCFCGGGSIPFEAARLGCSVYASDLNPIAGLLTWADINICGANDEKKESIQNFRHIVYKNVNRTITELGIEHNEVGDRAISYIYCNEVVCPECGAMIPLAPTWVLGKGTNTVVQWERKDNHYEPIVISNASAHVMKEASNGTITVRGILCPCCKKATSLSALRKDRADSNGNTISNLRIWEKGDFVPRNNDIFQERLYAIRYEHSELTDKGKIKTNRYYRKPNERDFANEKKVQDLIAANFRQWQEQGFIPSMEIESGYNTDQLIRERGWKYWHQLFNPRQLLLLQLFVKEIINADVIKECKVAALLGLNKCIDWNTKNCRWDSSKGNEKSAQTFYNQALNTLFNWGTRSLIGLSSSWFYDINYYAVNKKAIIKLKDARTVEQQCDIWITDPPYADAVNYHELSELFLSWDKTLLLNIFPEWYTDSKRVLAVRGDEHFSQTMIDIYGNLAKHMPDNGMQIVMFTHSDPSVWAQLALIMWKAGLKVTAAWNIATETDASGLKDGNYVKGTVLLVLRKQLGDEEAFLDEITGDIKQEVKKQIESMQQLDDKDDPNFSDPDYVLAAYAASLKVLTGFKSIEDIDLDYDLNLAIHNPSQSEVVKLIERAKKIAYDFIIPLDFDNFLWKMLSPAERFYIKGLEAEKHGNCQISTYQEYARGFGLTAYGQMMASERANTARLKTPTEFAMRTVSDVPEFEKSILRLVLQAIHVAVKEDENPEKGLWHLKNLVVDYWNQRDMLKQLLAFLKDTKDIDTMPHWSACAEMAEHIYVLVDNDHV